jgi:hypothetical protein
MAYFFCATEVREMALNASKEIPFKEYLKISFLFIGPNF